MIDSLSAFVVGGLWAVILAGYDVLQDRIPDLSPVESTDVSLRPVVDTVIVGGGSGAALWVTHHHFSALAFGAVGYLLVGSLLCFEMYWPLSESDDEPSSTDQ